MNLHIPGHDISVDELREPLGGPTRALLRRAVQEHAADETRRRYPPTLHVGIPGDAVARLPLTDAIPSDPGLRTDIVAALRTRVSAGPTDRHLVWLTRAGALDLQDIDIWWSFAVRAAYVEAGASGIGFVVVNRRGWRDPRSGLSRTWARVRPPRADGSAR